jgi:hypothetical protein
MWPWIVIGEFEVFVTEGEEVLDVGVDVHLWQWARGAGELQLGLLKVVEIEVGVARGMDEVATLESAHLCHHLEQKGIGGDIEGHSEEGVGTALVELEGEFAIGYIELEETVAGWESHLGHFGGVPC